MSRGSSPKVEYTRLTTTAWRKHREGAEDDNSLSPASRSAPGDKAIGLRRRNWAEQDRCNVWPVCDPSDTIPRNPSHLGGAILVERRLVERSGKR
ncbi:hypothetical protein G6F63_016894 [Rhizopus arrhizus]|nr:hypothetical protein G6F63_016894 [Rhizopus arrhizus]